VKKEEGKEEEEEVRWSILLKVVVKDIFFQTLKRW